VIFVVCYEGMLNLLCFFVDMHVVMKLLGISTCQQYPFVPFFLLYETFFFVCFHTNVAWFTACFAEIMAVRDT
jgi:hypothetical protein